MYCAFIGDMQQQHKRTEDGTVTQPSSLYTEIKYYKSMTLTGDKLIV